MSNLLSKINEHDMNLVNKRFFKNNDIEANELNILKKDFIIHKIEIKNTINKLYKDYLDISNNLDYDKHEEKYIYYFNMFLKKLIFNIKLNEKNNYIQNELSTYSNTVYDNSLNDNSLNNIIIDTSNNFINNLDKRTFCFKQSKNNTIHNYIQLDKEKQRILPQMINIKE